MTIADPELKRAKLWLAGKIEASFTDKTALSRTPETIALIQNRF